MLGLAVHDWQITRERDKLAMTHEALRDFLKIAGENLAFIPNTEKLREYLATQLLERYQTLGENTGPNRETCSRWHRSFACSVESNG